jgi:uncharacterized membrane protein
MTLFKPATFAALAAAIMTGISIYALNALPDLPARLPMTIAAHPFTDRHAAFILFVFPLVAALLAGAFALIAVVPLLRNGLERSALPYIVIGHGLVVIVLTLHLMLVAGAAGLPVDIARGCIIASGALLVLVGNYLPKVRYNLAIGVRTPWTLADERVWDRTHRVIGVGLLIAGIIAMLGGWLIRNQLLAVASLLIPTVTVVIAAMTYPAIISSGAGRPRQQG